MLSCVKHARGDSRRGAEARREKGNAPLALRVGKLSFLIDEDGIVQKTRNTRINETVDVIPGFQGICKLIVYMKFFFIKT